MITPDLPPTAPEHDEPTLTSSLESLDNALNYRDWIVSLGEEYLGHNVLEIGAGHGTFTDVLRRGRKVLAVEPDSAGAKVLRDRFSADESVAVVHGVVESVQADGFESAVMTNVLEHIEDEQGALREIHDRLAEGGHLILWVPAFQMLYSDFDRKLGHYRRYRRGGLESAVRTTGFEVVESKYVNLPGWFSWLLMVRILRLEPTSPKIVRIFDRVIVPIVRGIERFVPVPFGQSVFLVALKPSASPSSELP